jgi:hypothetical protein
MAERSKFVDFISLKLSGCFVASRLAMMPLRVYRGAIKNRARKMVIPVFAGFCGWRYGSVLAMPKKGRKHAE